MHLGFSDEMGRVKNTSVEHSRCFYLFFQNRRFSPLVFVIKLKLHEVNPQF